MSRRGGGHERFHGYLIVDKPAGWTSHDVVARVRRLTGQRLVGHAGTLDPAATGVLPVALGDATKTLEHFSQAGKSYVGEITLGVETDSEDADGRVTRTAPVPALDSADVEAYLSGFVGQIGQIPPMYSAIKIGGERLHERARRGEVVEREARPVTIHELDLLDWSPPVARVRVSCSKGTYIRSLARDVGAAIGCGAHLSDLVRTATGPFTLADAWTMADLTELDLVAEWERVAIHPDAGIADLGVVILSAASRIDWRHGRAIADATATLAMVRVYDADGAWLGIASGIPEVGWQPVRVIAEAA